MNTTFLPARRRKNSWRREDPVPASPWHSVQGTAPEAAELDMPGDTHNFHNDGVDEGGQSPGLRWSARFSGKLATRISVLPAWHGQPLPLTLHMRLVVFTLEMMAPLQLCKHSKALRTAQQNLNNVS